MSDQPTLTRFRFFTVWQADQEVRWLEQMAREGWHLTRGGILFKFRKGPPSMVRYQLDYRTETGVQLKEYLDLCRDAGWEHVSRFANWHYFRTAEPSAPDLHTDPASLADRYKRILALLAIVLFANMPFFVTPRRSEPPDWITAWSVMNGVRLLLIVVLGYGIIRIGIMIRELKSKSSRHML